MRERKTFRDLLRDRLPEEVLKHIPRSFYVVGDIALVPLENDYVVKYGHEIAEAIMTIHRNVRAVYARGTRAGIARTCSLVHLGGERRTVTVHREYGIKIVVDVEKTYFNPALAEEHHRIAEITPPHSIVLDAFSGVGPFSLHIAKTKPSHVVAVDINAPCIEMLKKSVELNKLVGYIYPIHGDSIKLFLEKPVREAVFDVIIMNLPHEAYRYAVSALKLLKPMGLLHVYVIARNSEEAVKLLGKVEEAILVDAKRVLDYAPRKYIYRVTLRRASA